MSMDKFEQSESPDNRPISLEKKQEAIIYHLDTFTTEPPEEFSTEERMDAAHMLLSKIHELTSDTPELSFTYEDVTVLVNDYHGDGKDLEDLGICIAEVGIIEGLITRGPLAEFRDTSYVIAYASDDIEIQAINSTEIRGPNSDPMDYSKNFTQPIGEEEAKNVVRLLGLIWE